MQQSIKSRLGESQLADLLDRYDLELETKLLSDWHAFTFEVRRHGVSYILRVTDDTHRTKSEIEGELEWMIFLRANGITVPSVIPSSKGQILEVLKALDSEFTAVLFEKFDGRPVSDSDWNSSFFERWGGLVGRLHRLSTGTFRSNARPVWHRSDFLNVDAYIPGNLPKIGNAARELIASIKGHAERSSLSFGLMHADVYQANFFISGSNLQLFDFDNCEYGFLVNDVAISLYAALWKLSPSEDKQKFTIEFLSAFWKQYKQVFQLSEKDLQMLPLFLRLRDVLIYIVARKKLDLNNLTPVQAQLLHERGERIASKMPIVDVKDILG
jgi:amicoumacin kinase